MGEQSSNAEYQPTTSARIRAARVYENPGDLCVILCLFNIGSSGEKRANFELCRKLYDLSGIPLVVIECVFGDTPRGRGHDPGVISIQAASAMWQKERLINVALVQVPRHCTKIAWVDADILFENAQWAITASALLNHLAVVQLADCIIRLPRGLRDYAGTGMVWDSFAAVYARNPNALLRGDFALHGHTGFAWAARRSVLETAGLYDACVTGGGDHVMAHAFCGDWESPCLTRMMGVRSAWHSHAAAWASRVYPLIKARVGFVEGAALHLWHGELPSRRHVRRYRALWGFHFDPARDLALDENGCWRWSSAKPTLQAEVGNYLAGRRRETETFASVPPINPAGAAQITSSGSSFKG